MTLSFTENGFVTYRGSSSYRRIYVRQRLKECIVNDIEVYVHDDYNFHVVVLGRKIESSQCLKDLPDKISDENVRALAEYLGNLLTCKGLDNFEDIINEKLDISQPFLNEKGEVAAFIEDRDGQQSKVSNYKVIYHVLCEIFTTSEMKTCTKCKTYASTLRKRRSRMDQDSERKKLRASDSSTANYRFLTKVELMERLNNTQKEKQKSIQRVMNLTLSINNQIINEGVKTSKEQHSTLRCTVENAEPEFEENSPRWLLWQQQKAQSQKKRCKTHAMAPTYDSVVRKYLLHISSCLQTNDK